MANAAKTHQMMPKKGHANLNVVNSQNLAICFTKYENKKL
jgi:hypothetical protein